MAVLKRFRTQAKLEFFTNAEKIRRELFLLIARDFGVKGQIRTLELVTNGMSEPDKETFKQIAARYNLTRFNAEYPEWIISKCRDTFWDLTRSLLLNLTAANSIYPTVKLEAQQRRVYQDIAIGNCEQILKELQFIIEVFPISAKGYMPYIALIEKEITLIKGWRKSDNQRFRSLQ